jgi:hypothetical protein
MVGMPGKSRVESSVDSTSSTVAAFAIVIGRKAPCSLCAINKLLIWRLNRCSNFESSLANALPAGASGDFLTKDSQVFPQFLWKTKAVISD